MPTGNNKRIKCADGFSMSVPAQVIVNVCAKHGGVVAGDLPPGVIYLKKA